MVIISNTSYFQSVLSPTMPFISEVSKSDSYSLPLSLASPVSPPPSSPPAGLNAFPSPYTPVLSTSVSTCSRKALGESHNAPSTFSPQQQRSRHNLPGVTKRQDQEENDFIPLCLQSVCSLL